jgi:hypothetical protein
MKTPVGSPVASRSITTDGSGDRVARVTPARSRARLLATETDGGTFHADQMPRM